MSDINLEGGGINVDISQPRESSTTGEVETKKADETIQTSTEEETTTVAQDETAVADEDETESGKEGEHSDAPDSEGKYTHPETKAKVDATEMIEYYKTKFGASTSGAQALLDEKTALTSKVTESETTVAKLTKDLEEVRAVAEGKNPEGLNLVELQASNKQLSEELALSKEKTTLDDFEKTTPLAASKRAVLQSLARANPKETLQKLWDENLKAGAVAEAAKAKAKKDANKAGAGESGRGTSTREPAGNTIGGHSLDAFNKLPVAERRAILQKGGKI